jgi:hypothetical protein
MSLKRVERKSIDKYRIICKYNMNPTEHQLVNEVMYVQKQMARRQEIMSTSHRKYLASTFLQSYWQFLSVIKLNKNQIEF